MANTFDISRSASKAWLAGVWDASGRVEKRIGNMRLFANSIPQDVAESLQALFHGGVVQIKGTNRYRWNCPNDQRIKLLEAVLSWTHRADVNQLLQLIMLVRREEKWQIELDKQP